MKLARKIETAIILLLMFSSCTSLYSAERFSSCTSLYSAERKPSVSLSEVQEEERAIIEAAQEMRHSGVVQFNFRDMDVSRFLRFMSEVLQENIVIQSGITQKVTIFSRPATIEGARRIMITALEANGLTVHDTGDCLVVRRASVQTFTRVSSEYIRNGEIPSEMLERFIAAPLEEFFTSTRFRYNKKLGGLEVQWIHDNSFFKKMGVQRGDIIKAINGTPLVTFSDIDTIAQSINMRRRFDITIMREGKIMSLNHVVRATVKPENSNTAKPSSELPEWAKNIVAAVPGSQEGQLPGELVTNLMQNPFDELKLVRFRPNEKAGGLEIQWIQNDSLLKQLGLQRLDVIKSVNGIPFTNMEDIAKAINSWTASERFDVEIMREGENMTLRYVVK